MYDQSVYVTIVQVTSDNLCLHCLFSFVESNEDSPKIVMRTQALHAEHSKNGDKSQLKCEGVILCSFRRGFDENIFTCFNVQITHYSPTSRQTRREKII